MAGSQFQLLSHEEAGSKGDLVPHADSKKDHGRTELAQYQSIISRENQSITSSGTITLDDLEFVGFTSDEVNVETTLSKAWGISTALELVVIFVTSGMFCHYSIAPVLKVFWATFAIVLLIRCFIYFCYNPKQKHKARKWRLMTLVALLPFTVYLPMLFEAYVDKCRYGVRQQPLHAPDALDLMHGIDIHYKHTMYEYHTVKCDGIIPGYAIFGVQGAVQVGIPLIFGFMFVKLSWKVWSLDLLHDQSRTLIQLSMLNLLDAVTFVTMSVAPSTFVFLAENPFWRVIVNSLFVIAYLTVFLEIRRRAKVRFRLPCFAKQHKELRRHRGECCGLSCCQRWHNAEYVLPSFLAIDLPFLFIRAYFLLYVGCSISAPMFAKNFVCAANACCLFIFGRENPVSKEIGSILTMLPGAESVTAETAREIFLHNLRKPDDFEGKTKTANYNVQAKRRQNFETVNNLQQQAITNILDLISNGVPENVSKHDIEVLFSFFDFDCDGCFNEEELEQICALSPKLNSYRSAHEKEVAIPQWVELFMQNCGVRELSGTASGSASGNSSDVDTSSDDGP